VCAHTENSGTNCSATLPDGHNEYWGNNFVYDAWGNLLQKNVTKCAAETLSVAALANNRLSGYSYDAAGNMLSDGFHNYAYNADGMLTSVDSGAATYFYDGSAQRTRKNVGGQQTHYINFGGNAIAERNVSTGGWTNYVYFNGKRVARRDPSGAVHYYLGDHLGSTSMVVSAAGAIENESEFYPFGGELQFSAADPANHYKFTGKERDSESGLDYFGARNYSSTLGRWITPDRPFADQHVEDPQSWNLYGYARNNPLRYVDDDGRDVKEYKVLTSGKNQVPDTPHPEISDVSELGPVETPRGVYIKLNTQAIFDEGDDPADYKPIREAYILNGEGNVLAERRDREENPDASQTNNAGNSQFVYDGPGYTPPVGEPRATINRIYDVAFSLAEQNKKTKQISNNKLYYRVSMRIVNGKIVAWRAVQITQVEFLRITGQDKKKKDKTPPKKKDGENGN
jgi:RHS repeat-associated protein